MAQLLVETFGPDCEVVLHDLTTPQKSVVYVAGSVTGRQVGQSFDHLVSQVLLSERLQEDRVANYYFEANGRRIRSSTLLLRDDQGELVGAVCINLDTEPVRRQMEWLQTLLPQPPAPPPASVEPPRHVAEVVTSLIDGIIGGREPAQLRREDRLELIRFMEEKGIFLMKGSVEQVAQRLGVTKVTVYSYLDQIREAQKEEKP